MTTLWFDHFITYTSAPNIDDYLKEYAAQGFLPNLKTVRHDPGLRNGFIFFGPEYLEFCWVEDEELFAKADATEKLFRSALRPFGLGLIAEDVNAVHADWTARGYSVLAVWSKSPREVSSDLPPIWSFQEIPSSILPGAVCFAITYHTRPKNEIKQIKLAPNTIYAVWGVTFVTPEPEARAIGWRDLLAPEEQVVRSRLGYELTIGPHRAWWISVEAYQTTYGFDWVPSSHPFGELALLHLLATDLGLAKRMLEQSGRQVFWLKVESEAELFIAPDARDGFAFGVRQQPVEIWLHERMLKTGEKLRLA